MSHPRDIRAFSSVSNGVTRVGAVAAGLGNPGHNGPVSSWIRHLVKPAMHKTRRDPTNAIPNDLPWLAYLSSVAQHYMCHGALCVFIGPHAPTFNATLKGI